MSESSMQSSVESTTLNLLTREGAISFTFSARLTAEQYARLYDSVHDCDTRKELRECIATVANEWGIEVVVDEG
jgi:hypothetical protein